MDVEKTGSYFTNLCDFVDRESIEFSFVTFGAEGEFTESIRARDLFVRALDARERTRLPFAARSLWRIMKDQGSDIVHTHLFDPTVVGLSVARWQGRKAMFTRHHSDAIHALASAAKRSVYLAFDRRNNRLAHHIVAPSRMVRECLVDWEGVPSDKVSWIPYGQTRERFDAITAEVVDAKRAELGMNAQLSLVCVSRLFHRKGHEVLFDALTPLIKQGLAAKLYLVGTGEFRERLERLTERLEIAANVEFLGWRSDVLEILGGADIVVHPSLEDALSQSLIESLALSRPIVATDISGAADTLDGGKYGRLVPPGDVDAFRRALCETIDDLPEARRRAEEGREYLLEFTDARRVARDYTAIYTDLVAT